MVKDLSKSQSWGLSHSIQELNQCKYPKVIPLQAAEAGSVFPVIACAFESASSPVTQKAAPRHLRAF